MHAAGAGAQVQSAPPAAPPQGLPVVQVFTLVDVVQPSLLVVQLTTVLPLQTVPVTPLQTAAAAWQRQSALPGVPLQGLPALQVLLGVAITHPSAVVEQTTTVLPLQTAPFEMPMHSAGAALQRQAALPAEPWQVCAVPQLRMPVMAGQPSAFEPQVIIVEPLVQTLPCAPMQAAGAASHEQDAMGKAPVHGLPAGQPVDGPLYTQPSASAKQFSSVLVLEQ